MPAATVDNLLLLPRIPRPDAAVAVERPVVRVVTAPAPSVVKPTSRVAARTAATAATAATSSCRSSQA